ncbi:MAG: hypothetical protein V1720_22315 [bacterium]
MPKTLKVVSLSVLLLSMFSCKKDPNFAENIIELTQNAIFHYNCRPPDSWFNIDCQIENFFEDDSCVHLSVYRNNDYYSIRREHICNSCPSYRREEQRGDIIISYKNDHGNNANIWIRKFGSIQKACYYEIDYAICDVIGDELWFSTIDITEYEKLDSRDKLKLILSGMEYHKIKLNKIILDFNKEYLNKDFFNSITYLDKTDVHKQMNNGD